MGKDLYLYNCNQYAIRYGHRMYDVMNIVMYKAQDEHAYDAMKYMRH